MSILDELITDRTGPGKYDWQDFNRVGKAVEYVAGRLREAGYTADVVTKTDWTRQGIQSRKQMEQYITNIQTLRDILAFPPEVPAAPDTIRFLTWQKANAVETIVSNLDTLITSLQQIYIRANMPTAYAGLAYYVPEMTYLLCDSEGVSLLDNTGVQLISR